MRAEKSPPAPPMVTVVMTWHEAGRLAEFIAWLTSQGDIRVGAVGTDSRVIPTALFALKDALTDVLAATK